MFRQLSFGPSDPDVDGNSTLNLGELVIARGVYWSRLGTLSVQPATYYFVSTVGKPFSTVAIVLFVLPSRPKYLKCWYVSIDRQKLK